MKPFWEGMKIIAGFLTGGLIGATLAGFLGFIVGAILGVVIVVCPEFLFGRLIFMALSRWRCPRCNYPLKKEKEECPNCGQPISWATLKLKAEKKCQK